MRLLLGKDYGRLGELHVEEPFAGVACALSVGAQASTPAARFKGDARFPNEDCLLVGQEGSRLLLAVADGHLGHQVSHEALTRVADWGSLPRSRGELALLCLGLTEPPLPTPGGTSLLVGVLDQASGKGFALSWGDSSLVVLGPEQVVRWWRGNESFLRGTEPCDPSLAETIDFELGPDNLLLLFTDGINECHYRSPLTSIAEPELAQIRQRTGPAPLELCRALGQQALQGVRGFPGGEDNLGLIVAQQLQSPTT